MNKRKFMELLMQANQQFIVQVHNMRFCLNLKRRPQINDVGFVAVNELTNRASIVFLEQINEIIIDNKTFFIKS